METRPELKTASEQDTWPKLNFFL